MCSDKYDPEQGMPWGYIDLKRHFDEVIKLRFGTVEKVMIEREKASIIAAQALITKDGSEQLAKFVLKQELSERIKEIRDKIEGPLGLELRMRTVEQDSRGAPERENRISVLEQKGGALSAQLYLVIIGLPLAVAVLGTLITYIAMVHWRG